MFDNLRDRLTGIVKELKGQAQITEANMAATLREVRMALLEADVALPVVTRFIDTVRQNALGQSVMTSLTPGQAMVKIVQHELISLMGETGAELNLHVPPPAVILLAGLQGAGKTTTVAKLGCWLQAEKKKSVMVASCDVYRPAALEQLEILARDNALVHFPATPSEQPVTIAAAALQQARTQFVDVLLVDTAGRLHIDAEMMQEISEIHAALSPSDTVFVVDSMMGQDAVNAANAFNAAVPLTGTILTKTDGDARGGAALSVRHVTGKPILFMGTGEKSSALSPFYPERIASRILGMGDVLSLIEEVEQKADQQKAERLARKVKQGKGFNLTDYQEQIRQMQNLGGLAGIMDKLPSMGGTVPAAAMNPAMNRGGDEQLARVDAIINSMTPGERRHPAIINGARKKRIAGGSGTQIQDVNRVLKQFTQMQKMMRKLSKKRRHEET